MAEQTAAPAIDYATPTRPIVATPGRYYRVARYLMTLLLIGYGAWSIYDGFYSWPNWPISHPNEKPKTHTDIILNQILGCALPPMGLFVLGWAVYNSRGHYRLENDILTVPGHPPIPLDKIHSINKEAWDRKGIAYIEYETEGKTSTFKLDDFVYEREPTDQIFKIIEDHLLQASTPAPPAQPAPKAQLASAPKAQPAVAPKAPAAQPPKAQPAQPQKPQTPPRPRIGPNA